MPLPQQSKLQLAIVAHGKSSPGPASELGVIPLNITHDMMSTLLTDVMTASDEQGVQPGSECSITRSGGPMADYRLDHAICRAVSEIDR